MRNALLLTAWLGVTIGACIISYAAGGFHCYRDRQNAPRYCPEATTTTETAPEVHDE